MPQNQNLIEERVHLKDWFNFDKLPSHNFTEHAIIGLGKLVLRMGHKGMLEGTASDIGYMIDAAVAAFMKEFISEYVKVHGGIDR